MAFEKPVYVKQLKQFIGLANYFTDNIRVSLLANSGDCKNHIYFGLLSNFNLFLLCWHFLGQQCNVQIKTTIMSAKKAEEITFLNPKTDNTNYRIVMKHVSQSLFQKAFVEPVEKQKVGDDRTFVNKEGCCKQYQQQEA